MIVLFLIPNYFYISPVHVSNQLLPIKTCLKEQQQQQNHIFVNHHPSWEDSWLEKKMTTTEDIIDCPFPKVCWE